MTRYEWTTAKGARVALEVERVETPKIAYADGLNINMGVTVEQRIARLAVNGAEITGAKFGWAKDRIEFALPDHPVAAVLIPQEIAAQIWAEERAEADRQAAADDKREAYDRRMYRAMNTDERPYK